MSGLTLDQRDTVLDRLGFADVPPNTRDGLDALYLAWGRNVPFDNTRKLIALGSGTSSPLPGGTAADFFDAWLAHGTGGTCWPSSNALVSLLQSCDFDVRRVAGSMFETGELNHGSAVVTIDDGQLLVDSSMLTDVPFELAGPDRVHPVHPVLAEPVGDTWRFRWGLVDEVEATSISWLLMRDPTDHATYLERYEDSRTHSGFNAHRYARRNDVDGIRALVKDARCVKTTAGLDASRELGAEQQDRVLVEDIGLSEEIVARLRAVLPGAVIG